MNGRLVSTLSNGFKLADNYSVDWNANSEPSGMYFLKIKFGEEMKSEKIMLIK